MAGSRWVDWVALRVAREERRMDEQTRRTMGLRAAGLIYSHKGAEWNVPKQLFVSSADGQYYIKVGPSVYIKRSIWEAQ